MSSSQIQIGTQTITPTVKDLGDKYYIEFNATITSYLGNQVNQTITVKLLCDKYKMVLTSPMQPPQQVQKTVQECVDEFAESHKNIYTFA